MTIEAKCRNSSYINKPLIKNIRNISKYMDYCLKCDKYIMPEVQSRSWLIVIIFIAPIPRAAMDAKFIATAKILPQLTVSNLTHGSNNITDVSGDFCKFYLLGFIV